MSHSVSHPCGSGDIEEDIEEEDEEASDEQEGTESTADSEGVVLGSPSSRPGSRNMTGVGHVATSTSPSLSA